MKNTTLSQVAEPPSPSVGRRSSSGYLPELPGQSMPSRLHLRQSLAERISIKCVMTVEEVRRKLPMSRRKWSLVLLRSLEPDAFRTLAIRFLAEIGFQAVRNSEASHDHGVVDLWLWSDRKIGAVQCHPGADSAVAARPIQALAVIMAANALGHGVVFTQGIFSREARAFVEGRSIELIDGEDFVRKLGTIPEEIQQKLLEAAVRGSPRKS
jgi:restriction endonuclease Mrr